jgi:hypothetical protein
MILSILVSFFTSLVTPVDTSIHTTVEAQAIVSDAGVTPFWMRSLQYGSVPMENPGLVLRAWNGKGYNLKKKYDWKYEVEATGWTGIQNDIWLTQAYVSGRRGKWELWVGRRKEVYGLGDTAMTSGFYSWSGNAVPMPKVQLGTRDYLDFAKGWLGVHMTYSHGWFDNENRNTINAYLHQKSLYGRLGKPNSKVSLFAGINHQVDWGGESKIKTGSVYDFYPSSINTYFYVLTLLKDRTFVKVDSLTSGDDSNNQYGNHLGSIDLAIKFRFKRVDLLFYKQSIYETGRIANLSTINDGLWGMSIKMKNKAFLQSFVFEYLYTGNQGQYQSGISKLLGLADPHAGERENYFGNLRGSYSYFGKSIGTPLIIINSETKKGGNSDFYLSAVKSLNISIKGFFLIKYSYKIRHSYSKIGSPSPYGSNYITPDENYITQYSSELHLERLQPRFNVYLDLANDFGDLLKNSNGIRLGVIYKIM